MAPSPAQSKLLRGPPPGRPASFHGSPATASSDLPQIRRPKTQPDLLDSIRTLPPPAHPPKILVKVTVQRSLGPVQVMASTDWTVLDLMAAVIKIYIEEERLPLLCSTDPSAFGLHYSQFSLESLDPDEKLVNFGSRSFFLCPKRKSGSGVGDRPAGAVPSSPSCWKEVQKGSRTGIPWLRFMDCLL
ncbi:uncharacterized protein At4g22758-like [Phalaenopsis equestris]|uniref:uncharacterized protein At4g22758-like n=1 Tax=Phalaenopsis equestris TaxID=78828 RepID=UPI0009E3F201|nr:uncharacterized protein At4g22758-like [Phalaenopsis equestris]